MQNAVRSGMGLLGMHPSASLTHPGLAAQRLPGLLPLDVRPNLLQTGAAGRFPLLMQQGHVQSLLDSSLQAQARARAPFSQLDPFNRAPNLNNESLPKTEDESSSGADEGKDQDYRFPPMEKQSTGLLRTPPPEQREPLGGPSTGRPPLLQTPGTQPSRTSLAGRLQALAGFTPENRWNQTRGDFDERDGLRGDRSTPGQNFPSRFDNRPAVATGTQQAWNRGGPATPFESELHQDLDDRRRPWERQRDRDERDFDFRREMNGSRHSRDRERDRDRDRDRGRERNRDQDRERERDKDRERERDRGNWTPLLPLPTPLLPTPPLNPNLTLNPGKMIAPLKLNPQIQPRFLAPPMTQAKPSILGLNQPQPLVPNKSPPLSQGQEPVSEPTTESTVSPAPQTQSPIAQSSAQSPESKDLLNQSAAYVLSPSQPESPAQAESPSQPDALPPHSMASPDPKTLTQASPPVTALSQDSSQDSYVAFEQAASPPEETSPSPEKQDGPQMDEESRETVHSPLPLWVNSPEMDNSSIAEPTPEASPESTSELSSNSVLPKSEAEQQEQPASPKDVNVAQSEALEEAASQPVVDTVTDTDGT